MITAVLDTNVLVSGSCLPDSLPGQLIRLWLSHAYEVALSEDILREFADVMRRRKIRDRYQVGEEAIAMFDSVYRDLAQMVSIKNIPKVPIADPADSHVLACASQAKVEYIVTGDRHLLELGQFENTQIVTPARFYAELQASGLVL